MLGAIIGDIVGSRFEFHPIKSKSFKLFTEPLSDDNLVSEMNQRCRFTDDTVLTCAIANALMKCENGFGDFSKYAEEEMHRLGRLYPNRGFGGRFFKWLRSETPKPYDSFGNGSAMRVSPCAWVVPLDRFEHGGLDDVSALAEQSAVPTHNHPEGIKGAQAVARAIYFARVGASLDKPEEFKDLIRDDCEKHFHYDMNRALDEIRPTYDFDETCPGSVPESIIAFLESDNFEDAIRNAVSLGGDADTQAAIAGSIAEAAYGIPNGIQEKAMEFLDKMLGDIVKRWEAYLARK